ncbi:MAG: CHASE2 domain-containing protein, partial [Endozoicomonas sp.]
ISRFAAPFYGSEGQPEVTVIQINDQVLNEMNLTWPLNYQQHARILRRVLSYEPRAVFIDFLYTQDRDPNGLKSLVRILEKHNDPQGKSPVYIADVIGSNGSIILPELKEGTLRARVNWSHFAGQYPLQIPEDNQVWETPATALFKTYCLEKGCDDKDWLSNPAPMSIHWGTRVDTIMDNVTGDSQNCREYEPGFMGSLGESLRLLLTNTRQGLFSSRELEALTRQKCLYSRYLFANQLAYRGKTTNALLTDRIVLIGGIFQGIPDYTFSPVHGKIPGVFMHAMALDNLITLKHNYMKAPEAVFSFLNMSWADLIELILAASILFAVALAAHYSWLSSIGHKTTLFAVIVVVDFAVALVMTLYLNYTPVNALAILFLTLYALTVVKSEDLKITTNQPQ